MTYTTALVSTHTSMDHFTKEIGSLERSREKEFSLILILSQELHRNLKDCLKMMRW